MWLSIVVEILVRMHLIISEQDALHGHGLERRKVLAAAAGGYAAAGGGAGAGGGWTPGGGGGGGGGAAVESAGEHASVGSKRGSRARSGVDSAGKVTAGGRSEGGPLRSVRSVASAGLRTARSGPLFSGGAGPGQPQATSEELRSDEVELGALKSTTRSTDEIDKEAYATSEKLSNPCTASGPSSRPGTRSTTGAGANGPSSPSPSAWDVNARVVQEGRIHLRRSVVGGRPTSWTTSKPGSRESGVRVDVDVDVAVTEAAEEPVDGEAFSRLREPLVSAAAAAAAATAANPAVEGEIATQEHAQEQPPAPLRDEPRRTLGPSDSQSSMTSIYTSALSVPLSERSGAKSASTSTFEAEAQRSDEPVDGRADVPDATTRQHADGQYDARTQAAAADQEASRSYSLFQPSPTSPRSGSEPEAPVRGASRAEEGGDVRSIRTIRARMSLVAKGAARAAG